MNLLYLQHPDIFLAKLRDDWEEFALGLVSNVHMFTVENLESMTGSLGFLQEIARIMQQSHYVQDIQAFLNRCFPIRNFPSQFQRALFYFLLSSHNSSSGEEKVFKFLNLHLKTHCLMSAFLYFHLTCVTQDL